MLNIYRALDLTDEKGFLCGKLLGDLGVDVIKVEKPGGDQSRNIGPFYKDIVDPEKSLYWFAFNINKRGITLDIEKPQGRIIFRNLVSTADFLLESFPVGYLDSIGLGYSELRQVNPRLIFTSISPFGQSGPYKDYKASDIVTMAMAGVVYVSGDLDRPPVRVSFPQSYQFAGTEAAAGTLMALYYRNLTGEGQQVDISMQWSTLPAQYDAAMWWAATRRISRRRGSTRMRLRTGVVFNQFWPCKDGFVTFYYFGGAMGAHSNKALVDWMMSEDLDCNFLANIDWKTFDWENVTQEDVWHMEEPTARFFLNHTKAELYNGAVERGIMVYPMSTPKDILESGQLASRHYWVSVRHPELDMNIQYPGPFIGSENMVRDWRRAPLVGEHNDEIYRNDLGLTTEQLKKLRQERVI
jgi:crotonobetainyl-CoA:carnitine CoA-transferase CaiB-like acyl-CoA transferase